MIDQFPKHEFLPGGSSEAMGSRSRSQGSYGFFFTFVVHVPDMKKLSCRDETLSQRLGRQ